MKTDTWRYAVGSSIVVAVLLLSQGTIMSAPNSEGHRHPSLAAASFPFRDGFEAGTLGGDWTAVTTNDGRVEIGSSYAYTGTYSLMLDDSHTDAVYSTAAAILTIDLSGQTEVELDFWWREFDDDNHGQDGVFISDDDGANWHQAFSFNNGPYFWRHQIVDLDEEAGANGLTLNDHFQVKFQFYDDDGIPEDGYAIDEVRVRAPAVPIPASFPYHDGFESGELGAEWVNEFTYEGRVEVGSYDAYSGTYSLMLDDSRTDTVYSTAAAILTIDLSGQTEVELDFWWREFDDDNHGQDGVFISDDDGANWHQAFSFNNGPYFWRHQIVDLDEEAGANGLTLNDHFQVKFQFYDDDGIPEDGYAIDEVRVRAPAVPIPASFPYYDGFESGELGAEWVTEFTYEGRVEVGSSYAYSGTRSLMLDDSRTDTVFSTAAAILTVDLSGQTDVMLDFWWREFLDEDHGEDGVFISDDDGANWHQAFSFNGGPYTWQRQVIDLVAAAAANGLTLNDHFQVKFQFYDDDEIPEDGYAIDEVQMRLNAAPTLFWPGDTNYEQDGLHPESGDVGDDYVYRILYVDVDGDLPDYVRVHIERGGTAIVGVPFTMTCEIGDYSAGVLCSYTKTGLEVGDDYVYYFVAQDDRGNPAVPTTVIDAPDVTITYRAFLPLVFKSAGPPAASPILDPIDNPEGHYSYTLTWSAVQRATRYVLEEDDDVSFFSPNTVYSGPATSTVVLVEDVGTYHYRVRAENAFGESGWSNIESTAVTVAPPPCPQAGSWSGYTDQAYSITFAVADTPDCEVTTLKITARLDCIFNPNDLVYTVEYLYAEEIVARAFEYTLSQPNHSERVGGDFTSQTAAEGQWYFYVPDPSFPIAGRFCIGSGSWSATYSP